MPGLTCPVACMAHGNIKKIKAKIQDLNRMLNALEKLDSCCDGQGPVSECPILKSLAEDSGKETH